MSPAETAAIAAIYDVYADPQPILYVQDSVTLDPIRAIWSDDAAAGFEGVGSTLRKLTYEIRQVDVPKRPSKRDSFTHNGRRWEITDITQRDDVGAWSLVVVDAGAAA